jgi:hypothetical protein
MEHRQRPLEPLPDTWAPAVGSGSRQLWHRRQRGGRHTDLIAWSPVSGVGGEDDVWL